MISANDTTMWRRYEPTEEAPWNARRVVHLHRRAGFAATWNEIQRDVRDGPDLSIRRLLSGKAHDDSSAADFINTSRLLARHASNIPRLKAWWFFRMLASPDPLGERLTLMWHNHFATSAAKVEMAVRPQNQIFREFARAKFGELVGSVVHDPALLIWLDAPTNSKANPNENLSRELMELFTLGIGHYDEQDVKEAARALTGWTVSDGIFEMDPAQHDSGDKTILGQTGPWTGDDLIKILLDHEATAERLAWRICTLLMGETTVIADAVRYLAEGLRERELDISWAIETVLGSRDFFSEQNIGARVLGPPEFIVGCVRSLGLFDPLPNTLILAEWSARMGQNLFYPPNVGGWASGRHWVSSRAIIARANFAKALLDGEAVGLSQPVDVLGLCQRHGYGEDWEACLQFFAELVLGSTQTVAWRRDVLQAFGKSKKMSPENVSALVAVLLASPEAQLG